MNGEEVENGRVGMEIDDQMEANEVPEEFNVNYLKVYYRMPAFALPVVHISFMPELFGELCTQ